MNAKFEPFLTQFWVNDVITGVKTAVFKESDLRKNSLPQSFIKCWFQSFYHSRHMIYNFWRKWRRNIPEFWKYNWRTGFDLLKMQMTWSAEVSIVVWSRYITLKLFWRTLENGVIKGHLFLISHQEFHKNFVILVFRNKYYLFLSIFIMIDWKLSPN